MTLCTPHGLYNCSTCSAIEILVPDGCVLPDNEEWHLASREMPPDGVLILTWHKDWDRPDVAIFEDGKVWSGWTYCVDATHWRLLHNTQP